VNLGLTGRRALITGASKGIGRAIALELSREGAEIAICARGTEALEAVRDEIESTTGRSVFSQRCDVTDPSQVSDTVASVVEHFGGLDILVNNAGAAHPGRFDTLKDEDWRNDIDTKLMSQIRCIRASLPALRLSNHARIVNINAIYARYPDPAFLASSVNRASCLSLSKALSIELASDQILVNSVNIGIVDTPQWDNIHQRRAPERSRAAFLSSLTSQEVPLGRIGHVEEVSGIVAFLVSNRSTYITGASIDVSGGMGQYL
jgi:NAD(P)-dependent dehydrogenase (short-subunit alcohol dehydrogenase family)